MRLARVAAWGLVFACAGCNKNTPVAPGGPDDGSSGAGGSSTTDGAGSPDVVCASGAGGACVPCPAPPPTTNLFLTATAVPLPAYESPGPLALGDLNGDGLDDLVIAANGQPGAPGVDPNSLGGSLEVVFAGKAKLFTPGVRYAGLPRATFLAIADWNGDKLPDVVAVSGLTTGPMMISLNTGGGALAPPTSYSLDPNLGFFDVGSADFDGDGRSEIVFATQSTPGLSPGGVVVLKSTGASGYTTQRFDEGFDGTALAVGDLDGRTGADLVVLGSVPQQTGYLVHVLLNDGSGRFATPISLSVQPGVGPIALADVVLADVDGDGKLDIVGVFGPGLSYGVFLNQGGGRFADLHALPLGDHPQQAVFGDVDGDGKVDAVVSGSQCPYLLLYLNDGKGSFLAPSTILAGLVDPGFALGDVNGDHALDLVLFSDAGVQVLLHRAP